MAVLDPDVDCGVIADDEYIHEKKRHERALREFAARINSKPVGVTPKWKRAIESYKLVMSKTIDR